MWVILGLAVVVVAGALVWADYHQIKHSVRRNFPVMGRFRYWFEELGEYFRQYWFSSDREELPFNRATRSWVYRQAKGVPALIGFGSTNDLREPGSLIFVNSPFPALEEETTATPPLWVGEGFCRQPFLAHSVFNVSGMSFGAISEAAVRALSLGAAKSGAWIATGEGGLSPYHLQGGGAVIFQMGTAKYGIRDSRGQLDWERARQLGEQVAGFEIKLSQGAKPGKGGVLPGVKVTPEIAAIRGIPVGQDSLSPNRHTDFNSIDGLLDLICRLREVSGRPVGIKTALGGRRFTDELCERILVRGLAYAPDFISVDGGDGGSGAAPQSLADHVSLPIVEALPLAAYSLLHSGLKERIRLNASGRLVNSSKVAWALCMGADFVSSARGMMFALGCIQSMKCHTNACPTGIATQNKKLQRGLVVEDKAERVARYIHNLNHEVDQIAHSCGVTHARLLRREHVRIVQSAGRSLPASTLYPYPQVKR